MPAEKQYVSTKCKCGKKCGQNLDHYELVTCQCGRMYRALQPKRGGPLALFEKAILPGETFIQKPR